MIKNNFNYSETYFEGLLTGWNKVSYPIISKFAETSLKKYRPRTILDLGCGSGIYFNLFKQYATDVDGIDVSEQSVMLCREKGYRLVKLADAVALPFPDESFDYVFTSEVLEHVEDHTTMLKEIQRVLKPNGFFCLRQPVIPLQSFNLLADTRGCPEFYKGSRDLHRRFRFKRKKKQIRQKMVFRSFGWTLSWFQPQCFKERCYQRRNECFREKNVLRCTTNNSFRIKRVTSISNIEGKKPFPSQTISNAFGVLINRHC
jgi:SAM-dependent methyltransferase